MIQKLKDLLIFLLGGYSKKEYENQQTILKSIYKDKQRVKKQLEIIERDLKNSCDIYNIDVISRQLVIALNKIKNREYRIFKNYEYDCDNSILAISRDFKALLIRRNNSEWIKSLNIKGEPYYRDAFLKEYEFFGTAEWKKREAIQFDNGNKQLENEK